MASVYLSYCAEDAAAAQILADALTRSGFVVHAGRERDSGKLNAAEYVVVLWSPSAAHAERVLAEAKSAAHNGRLISTLAPHADASCVADRYRHLHCVPASDSLRVVNSMVESKRALVRGLAADGAGEKANRVTTAATAATGAAIGTAITPVVGTFIGAVAGAGIGMVYAFGKSRGRKEK